MNAKLTLTVGLLALGIAFVPGASAATAQASNLSKCYGVYDTDTDTCTGVTQDQLDQLLCRSNCEGLSLMSVGAGPPPPCVHVIGPFTIYNPLTGQPLIVQGHDYYVGICHVNA
jgi:hypothetical protein